MSKSLRVVVLLAAALLVSMAVAVPAQLLTIGEVTATIAEASTADDPSEIGDGQSGDTDFPYIGNLKALATVGEIDATSGMALTGYPDGHNAWLVDENTVRIAYQSESYATMSNETYPQVMRSGATFTGSHVHTIDYDRAGLASFLNNSDAASTIVKGSGHLYSTIYNVFGDEVVPRAQGGLWGNQATPDKQHVDYAPSMQLAEADFFVNSFCGAWYEPADKYGNGIGFADDVYMNAEEWAIWSMFTDAEGNELFSAAETMGLASIVVDIANETAYTVPALGQTGYEKIVPINPQHPDYVICVTAGYNHDLEPAPLKIYIGRKGLDANGQLVTSSAPERDQFLARNGLLYGRLYGLALANSEYARLGITDIDTGAKMMDAYLQDASAPDNFSVIFAPTSYQWGGWDAGVAVGETEMTKWQMASEQPAGYTYFVGDSKTEHQAVDPNIAVTRWVQNMTNKGGMLAIELPNIRAELAAADGGLPEQVSGAVVRVLGAYDGALTLDTGDKGIKHGGDGTHATWADGSAKMVAPDGLYWVRAADANVLIVDEDSGNSTGERKYALVLDTGRMKLAQDGMGYFLAQAGGSDNPRAAAGAAVYPGTFKKATSTEFSGSWDITALVATKSNGSFYTMDEVAGTGQAAINASLPLAEHLLIGVVQHKGESAGAVAEVQADQGGQLFMFNLDLPTTAIPTVVVELEGALPTAFVVDPAVPNPFNPSTSIRYQLPQAADVTVKVYNAAGQYVATLADGYQMAGHYAAIWDGRDASGMRVGTGVYLYLVQAGENTHRGRMTLLK